MSIKIGILGYGNLGKGVELAVNAAPDVREDVVASLKAAIKNGTYDVSGEAFADKLLSKFEEL